MIKGAIFDMDGLLLDTERVYRETWEVVFKEYGVESNVEFFDHIAGTSGEGTIACVREYYPDVNPEEFLNRLFHLVELEFAKSVTKKKGVDEILDFFRAKGCKIAVASGNNKKQICANLELAGIKEYFDEIVSGYDVEKGKPAPDIFLLAAKRLGVKPEECYVLEDGINGMLAGIAAGCHSIMIPDLIPPTEEVQENAYGIYTDLMEAMEYIDVDYIK